MKIRKVLSLLLVSTLLFGLVACGGSTSDVNEEKPQAEATDVAWPEKPVNAVLHASAGGDTDFNARQFGEYFEKITGQPLVITNMPGASGVASTEYIRQADTDGYTVAFMHTGPMIVNYVSGLVDYNFDDFDVAAIPAVDGGTVLVTSSETGLENMDDLINELKASPGSLVFGTELGNYSHLQLLILQDLADIEFKTADVGSAADKVTNLLGGRIDVAAISYGNIKDYLETGDLVALGQFNEERNPYLGDVPTMTEQGIDMVMDKPYILAFPKGTDEDIVRKMSDIVLEVSKDESYGEALKNGFSQEVKVYDKEESKNILENILSDYMKYQDELKAAN